MHPYINFNAIIFQTLLIVVRFDRRIINPEVEGFILINGKKKFPFLKVKRQ